MLFSNIQKIGASLSIAAALSGIFLFALPRSGYGASCCTTNFQDCAASPYCNESMEKCDDCMGVWYNLDENVPFCRAEGQTCGDNQGTCCGNGRLACLRPQGSQCMTSTPGETNICVRSNCCSFDLKSCVQGDGGTCSHSANACSTCGGTWIDLTASGSCLARRATCSTEDECCGSLKCVTLQGIDGQFKGCGEASIEKNIPPESPGIIPNTNPVSNPPPPNGEWAFEETFDGDPSGPSQALLPNNFEFVATHRSHPGHHFTKKYAPFLADHDDNCAGPNPNIKPLPQHYVETAQNSTGFHPDKSFFICKNHMMSSMGEVEGYSVSSFWPRQEFNFANGGELEFEVNINNNHTIRSWWEIMITPRNQLKVGAGPVESPISETYPLERIVFDFRRNVRTIRVGTGTALAPDGWLVKKTQRGRWDWSWWHHRHPDDPALNDRRIRRIMKISIRSNEIIWKIQTREPMVFDEFQVAIPGGTLPFTQGLVLFKTHAYTPKKDGNFDTYTFHWDNIRFNGPSVGFYNVYEANNVVYLQRDGSRPIGDKATVEISLPQQITNPVLFGQIHHPIRGQVQLSINGKPSQSVDPYEYDKSNCFSDTWKSFRLELDPNDLVLGGMNILQWTVGPKPDCVPPNEWNGFSVKFLQIQGDN